MNTTTQTPEGIYPALWTPTDAQGRLLADEFRQLIRFLSGAGVHGFLALGSTGEFLHLDTDERKRVAEVAIEAAAGLPVLVNVSDIRPRVARELALHAAQVGAAGVTILPPYYFALPQSELAEYFVKVGADVGAPVWLYNFPERTGVKIELETIAAVAERVPLAGIKQSGAEFGYCRDLAKQGREKDFVVFAGADVRIQEALGMGCAGCIGGYANFVPEYMMATYAAVKAGTFDANSVTFQRLHAAGAWADKIAFPINVMAGMQARHLPVGESKIALSATTLASCAREIEVLRGMFAEWGLFGFQRAV